MSLGGMGLQTGEAGLCTHIKMIIFGAGVLIKSNKE